MKTTTFDNRSVLRRVKNPSIHSRPRRQVEQGLSIKNKSKPVAKGKQKVFKQIEIHGSEDEDSENEEDYVPPKNYEDDYDDDSEDDNSGSEQDVQEILDGIKKDVPEVSKLSRKRKAKTSKGIYTRKET